MKTRIRPSISEYSGRSTISGSLAQNRISANSIEHPSAARLPRVDRRGQHARCWFYDGDLAVVDRSIEAVHGHIVIALLNNEPLCKRLYVRGKDVILLSENPKYPLSPHLVED